MSKSIFKIDVDFLSKEDFCSKYNTREKCIEEMYDILEKQETFCFWEHCEIKGKISDRLGSWFRCPTCGKKNDLISVFFISSKWVVTDLFLGYYVFTKGFKDIDSFRKETGFTKRRCLAILNELEDNDKRTTFCYETSIPKEFQWRERFEGYRIQQEEVSRMKEVFDKTIGKGLSKKQYREAWWDFAYPDD